MKIADISIRQPVFITMIILALVVVGILSYSRLGVDLMPDVSLPYVAVQIANPGVGPEEMESQVSKPIEDTLSTINGIDKITSTSAEGACSLARSLTGLLTQACWGNLFGVDSHWLAWLACKAGSAVLVAWPGWPEWLAWLV